MIKLKSKYIKCGVFISYCEYPQYCTDDIIEKLSSLLRRIQITSYLKNQMIENDVSDKISDNDYTN